MIAPRLAFARLGVFVRFAASIDVSDDANATRALKVYIAERSSDARAR